LRGDVPVPRATHLTWSELLMFTGSRARRRDRAFCRAIRVSDVSELIQRRILHALSIAGALRRRNLHSDRAEVGESDFRARAQNQLVKLGSEVIRDILSYLATQMQLTDTAMAGSEIDPCATCPQKENCRAARSSWTPGKPQEKNEHFHA